VDGTTHGGPTGPDEGTAEGSLPVDGDTAPQPVLTPELAAAAAAARTAEFAHRHPHERTPDRHHEAPGGHVEHPDPRHVVPADVPRSVPWARTAALVAAVLVVVGGVSAWALTRGPGTPTGQPTGAVSPSASPTGTLSVSPIDPTAAPGITQAAPMLPAGSDTLVLGDSLGLTVYPYFADLVPDRYVTYEAEVGRTTAGTADALRAMGSIPGMVIVSSGTNDPSGGVLEADAAEILDVLGPDRCVVWVDVVRPDSQYAPASELNAAIDRAAAGRDNVRVLQWTELVATHPGWMGGDGIHPTREGSIGRANAFAAASEACSPFDPNAPRARKQYLPLSAFYGPIAGGGSDSGTGSGNGSTSVATPSVSADAPAPAPSPSTTPSASPPPTSSAPATTQPPPTTSAPPKTPTPPPASSPPPSVAAAPPTPTS
jgi:hypothetical protein